jgi:hypothetical protein
VEHEAMGAKREAVRGLVGGTAVQVLVPGLYAWLTTVVPPAWSRGGSLAAKGAAVAAVVALLAGWWFGRKGDERARIASLWGFVLSSALCWSAAPRALGAGRVDDLRGVTGTLAWALFALAWAAPAFDSMLGDGRVEDDDALAPRKRLPSSGFALLAGAGIVAAAIQTIGWAAPGPERALLVRLASILSGLLIIEAAAEVILSRQGRSSALSTRARLRASRWWLIGLAGVVALGALLIGRG